jgi:hypothetical protein
VNHAGALAGAVFGGIELPRGVAVRRRLAHALTTELVSNARLAVGLLDRLR